MPLGLLLLPLSADLACQAVRDLYQTANLIDGSTGCCSDLTGSIQVPDCPSSTTAVLESLQIEKNGTNTATLTSDGTLTAKHIVVDGRSLSSELSDLEAEKLTPHWLAPWDTVNYKGLKGVDELAEWNAGRAVYDFGPVGPNMWNATFWDADELPSYTSWHELSTADLTTKANSIGAHMGSDPNLALFLPKILNKFIYTDSIVYSPISSTPVKAENHYFHMQSGASGAPTGTWRHSSEHQQYFHGHTGNKLYVLKYKVVEHSDTTKTIVMLGYFHTLQMFRRRDYFIDDEAAHEMRDVSIKGVSYSNIPFDASGTNMECSGSYGPPYGDCMVGTYIALTFDTDGNLVTDAYYGDYLQDAVPELRTKAAGEDAFKLTFESLAPGVVLPTTTRIQVLDQLRGDIARNLMGRSGP